MSGYAPINEILTVTASAGSGKTFRIAKEFLKWCLAEPPDKQVYRNILAVTFTNKATAEMKERILRVLKGMATGVFKERMDGIMASEIQVELELTANELHLRSRSVLIKILHDYSSLSITTIDSFAYRLVSTFSHDLHLPSNFEVELNFDNVLNTGVDLLIEKAGVEGEEKLTNVLLNFVAFQLDEEDGGLRVKGKIAEAGKALQYMSHGEAEFYADSTSTEELAALYQQLRKERQAFRQRIRDKAEELDRFLKEKKIDPTLTPYSFLKKLTDLRFVNTLQNFSGAFGKTFENILEGKAFYANTRKEIAGPMYDPWETELRLFLSDFNSLLTEYCAKEGLTEVVLRNFYPTVLLGSLSQEIEEFKKSDRKLHISDFNKYIQEVVTEPAPFIYERLGERFRAFLLDEFQDTAHIQWNNIKPLVENALSQEERNKVIVVGDAKQSIYGFRGADVNLILDLMRERTEGAYAIRTEPLVMNYRSLPQVVEFNNDFFAFASGYLTNTQHRSLYESGNQKPNITEPRGYVSLAPLEKEEPASQVVALVKDALSRNFRPKDIAVLIRNKGDAKDLLLMLQQEGIAYSMGSGNVLDDDPYVMCTLCLFDLMINADSDTALSLMASTLWKNTEVEIFYPELTQQAGRFLALEISKLDFRGFLINHFSLSRISQNGMSEAAMHILRKLNEKAQVSAMYQAWLSKLRKFESGQSNSAEEYLRYYWEDSSSRSFSGTAAEDKVLIETIHSSKGLEYPVVIIPKADWTLTPNSKDSISQALPDRFLPLKKVRMKYNSVLSDFQELETSLNELAEEAQLGGINLLYVAFTRAKNELYILYPTVKEVNEIKSVNHILQLYAETNQGSIEKGTKLVNTEAAKEEKSIVPDFVNEGWKDRIFVSWKAPKSLEEEGLNAREWGKLVHSILAKAESVEEARYTISLLREEGQLSARDAGLLEESVCSFMKHTAFKPFWALPGKRISERELVSGEGKILRPDKVIEHKESYTLIDFKTGEAHPSHREQMEEYAKSLQEMSGQPVRKVLLYLRDYQVVDWL